MTKEDNQLLDSLDIRVYTTVSGRQLVGEFEELHNEVIILNSTLEMVRVYTKDGVGMRMINAVAHNNGAPMHLYLQSIESESFASNQLKQLYYKQLLLDRLAELLTESDADKNKGYKQTFTDLDPPDYDWSNSIDRWSN